jgi:hypothetical protein
VYPEIQPGSLDTIQSKAKMIKPRADDRRLSDRPGPGPPPRLAVAAAQHQPPIPPSPDPLDVPPSDTSVRWAGQHIQPHFRHQVEPKPNLSIIRLSDAALRCRRWRHARWRSSKKAAMRPPSAVVAELAGIQYRRTIDPGASRHCVAKRPRERGRWAAGLVPESSQCRVSGPVAAGAGRAALPEVLTGRPPPLPGHVRLRRALLMKAV